MYVPDTVLISLSHKYYKTEITGFDYSVKCRACNKNNPPMLKGEIILIPDIHTHSFEVTALKGMNCFISPSAQALGTMISASGI